MLNRRFPGLIAVLLLGAAGPALAANVQVTTVLDGPATIEQGQTTTVKILAQVQDAASPSDGIFTFDLDVIAANLVGGEPSILDVVSVTRPNVDPDPLYGGNGTIGPQGIASIHGLFLADSVGLGPSPDLLATIVLRGHAPGIEAVTAGPSVDPYGFDFVLYESPTDSTSATYDSGVRITVAAIPEPSIAGLCAVLPLLLRRQRQGRCR